MNHEGLFASDNIKRKQVILVFYRRMGNNHELHLKSPMLCGAGQPIAFLLTFTKVDYVKTSRPTLNFLKAQIMNTFFRLANYKMIFSWKGEILKCWHELHECPN